MKSHAFTLIELLVVVLIIGILAAIALPKYQVAVKKSEVAKVISLVRIIAEHQKLYQLSTGRFADTLDQLDIGVTAPGGWDCRIANSGSVSDQNNKVECWNPVVNPTISVVYYYDDDRNYPGWAYKLYCWSRYDNTTESTACASFGKKIQGGYGDSPRYQIQ